MWILSFLRDMNKFEKLNILVQKYLGETYMLITEKITLWWA